MPKYALFGVVAPTLDDARNMLEQELSLKLDEREGLHAGGVHFSLGFPDMLLDLKNNLDLDDTELEFNGLSEPDFPDFKYLLYVNDIDQHPYIYRKIEARPTIFRKLRVD